MYRHMSPHRVPTSGAGARQFGGRWNSPDSFPVIYTAISEETARAEFIRLAARSNRNIAEFLPRHLYTLEVNLTSLLDLRPGNALRTVNLAVDDMFADDLRSCQLVGDAAHKLGREGILAPSATSTGPVLAIFELNLHAKSVVRPQGYIEWP